MHSKVEPDQVYKTGEVVTIKSKQANCAFGWVSSMNKYCGRTAVITSARFSPEFHAWRYEIDIDQERWGWCENCFEPAIPDLPEFDTSAADLTSLLS